MPNHVITDESKWNKAKAAAEKQGKAKNYALIMYIYKQMGGKTRGQVKKSEADMTLKSGKDEWVVAEIKFAGFPICIENVPASIRSGSDDKGKPWQQVFFVPYGYIKSTTGADGEELDVFLGPNEKASHVFIIKQRNPYTGEFDEDKVMLGFNTKEDAKTCYFNHYDNPDFFGGIVTMELDEFGRTVRKHYKLDNYKDMLKGALKRIGNGIVVNEVALFDKGIRDEQTFLAQLNDAREKGMAALEKRKH